LIKRVRLAAIAAALTSGFFLSGCSEESPAGPSVTISAPVAVSPAAGASLSTAQPVLTVSNVTVSDGSTPTYTFQVATDSNFASIAASAEGISQGAGGQTSWQVSTPLGNTRYYWRVRARAGTTDGPFSAAAEFSVETAFFSAQPRAGLLVFDPLTNGSSVGTQSGGEFTSRGWRVIARSNYIAYVVPTLSSGFFEVDITNLTTRNISPDGRMVFIMWDPSLGDFTENRFRVSVQKLDRRSSINVRYIRLRWISQGRVFEDFNSFIGWEPEVVYNWRMEWGPDGGVHAARVFLNGQQIMSVQYGREYNPQVHRIELGAAPRAETLEEAIYSNVRIGVR
jgi:hypothetical protein